MPGNGRVTQVTMTKVVMERTTAVAIADRLAVLERLLVRCRLTMDRQRTLLRSALAELAQERGANPDTFSVRWLKEHGGFEGGDE